MSKIADALRGALDQLTGAEPKRHVPKSIWLDLTKPPPKINWWVRDLLPERGRLLIIGPSNQGKSLFALNLAMSICSRTKILDCDTIGFPQEREVWVIDEEAPPAFFLNRAQRIGKANGFDDLSRAELRLSAMPGLVAGSDRWYSELVEPAAKARPGLIVLDPAVRILKGEENQSQDVSQFWRLIGELQRSADCAVAIVHHTGWQHEHRPRGSADWTGGADVQISIARQEVTWGKNRHDPLHGLIGFNLEPESLILNPDPDAPVVAFQKLLDEYGTLKAIVEATGMGWGRAHRLHRLTKKRFPVAGDAEGFH